MIINAHSSPYQIPNSLNGHVDIIAKNMLTKLASLKSEHCNCREKVMHNNPMKYEFNDYNCRKFWDDQCLILQKHTSGSSFEYNKCTSCVHVLV